MIGVITKIFQFIINILGNTLEIFPIKFSIVIKPYIVININHIENNNNTHIH